MNHTELGFVQSSFTVGGLIGAVLSGPAAMALGRLRTMQYNTILFILGPVAEALAPNIAVMALGRFISGLGAGAAVVVVPIYISEVAPPARKGFFGSFTQVMTNVGIFTTQLLGFFFSRGQLWRIVLAVGGAFGALQLMGLFFAVESPKWDVTHGRIDEAKTTLRKIRGPQYDIKEEVDGWHLESSKDRQDEEDALLASDNQPHNEASVTQEGRKALKKSTIGMLDVIIHPNYNRAIVAVMAIMVAQQLCGINSIVMYGVSLLSDLLTTSAGLLNVFVAVINLSVTLSCAPLIDKIGRKPCLLISIIGMGTSSFLLAIAIKKSIAALSAVAVLTFVGSFGVGLGPVPFILSSELVGPEAVGATQSWALSANWISTFVVSFFFPILNQKMGKGNVYFLFTAFAAFFASFIVWRVPETRGKKDADEVWGRKTNCERSSNDD